MATEKRVVFRSAWLPYLLLAPQIAITGVFFFWPAGMAVWQSMLAPTMADEATRKAYN